MGGTYYSLKVELNGGNSWSVYFNDHRLPEITSVIDDVFNNAGNALSGFVGIRNVNAAIDVKSFFVSGEPQYFDTDSWHLSCTLSPTSAPTQSTENANNHDGENVNDKEN